MTESLTTPDEPKQAEKQAETVEPTLEAQLEEKYAAKRLQAEWQQERETLLTNLAAVSEKIVSRYTVREPLNLGGSGVCFEVHDLEFDRAAVLKLPRPVPARLDVLNVILGRETQRLRDLRHQNVIRILHTGKTESGVAFYVMEKLTNAGDADLYLKTHPTMGDLMRLFGAALAGVQHIHHNGLAHLDLKPANLFVDDSGALVVADFGFAKKFDEPGPTILFGGTEGFMHEDYLGLLRKVESDRRHQSDPDFQVALDELQRELVRPIFDIYSLGITLLLLLRLLEIASPKVLRTYDGRYLRLMAYRMLDGRLRFAEGTTKALPRRILGDDSGRPLIETSVLGLHESTLKELAYTSIDQVVHDFEKLGGALDLTRMVPEFARQQTNVIQAASHTPIPFTSRVRALQDAREVRALGKLRQLGLVSMVYPTASHSRLEHTLGTFGMATRYLRALYNDSINPVFRQIMDEDDIASCLAACLVHDVGHYPLAHDLEEVDEELFSHERRTRAIVHDPNSEINQVLTTSEEGWEVDIGQVVAILTRDEARRSLKTSIMRSILDGPIDADKLDYLIRDSEDLRVPFGQGIDVDRLLQALTVVVTPSGSRSVGRIAIHEKGKIAAESLAFARYAMYGAVYWHRTHRCVKAMLSQVVFDALEHAKETGGRSWRANFQKRLDAFLVAREAQLSLDVNVDVDHGRPILGESPFLDEPTELMLEWLASEAGPVSNGLVQCIRSRTVYKRALVVSRARSEELDWGAVDDVYGRAGHRWERRQAANRRMQQKLVEEISDWDGEMIPLYSIASGEVDDLRAAFILDAQNERLALVDYPPVKAGAKSGLEYLREREWTDEHMVEFEVDSVEESRVWKLLFGSPQSVLGKLRVFVHPDYARLILSTIPRRRFEELVFEAVKDAADE
jgi:HD superfamily phosphohydrolase/serine/threonine protein kinase